MSPVFLRTLERDKGPLGNMEQRSLSLSLYPLLFVCRVVAVEDKGGLLASDEDVVDALKQ